MIDCSIKTILLTVQISFWPMEWHRTWPPGGEPCLGFPRCRLRCSWHADEFTHAERLYDADVETHAIVMAADSVMEVAHKASALSGKPRLQLWTSTLSRPSRNAGACPPFATQHDVALSICTGTH